MAWTQDLFPEIFFQLQDEISFHPELQVLLLKHPANEFEIRMAEIAAYSGVLLDGFYSLEDFEKIAALCITGLKKRAMDEATKTHLGKH